ncbi:EndoU domain-containing protein [Micromonospora sp. WMMD1102]|nr:EndoU domain-containing protein [Micromonospora sp. WMMD1102]MDG4785390.1 EndoU domain-containing protein [Micromonospora sp. WMMD1102]
MAPIKQLASSFTRPPGGYTNLLSPSNAKHILKGDSPTSGGHAWPGNLGKSTFPWHWSDRKILHAVSDIVSDPATARTNQTGTQGALYTNAGNPAKWRTEAVRFGKKIRVIYQPASGNVPTAFPPR